MSSKPMTIATKLKLITIFLLLMLTAAGIEARWNLSKISQSLNDVADTQLPAIRAMTLADMMHDAIRANAFNAIILAGSKDEEKWKSVSDERKEFASELKQNLDTLALLPLDAEVKADIEKVQSKLEYYTNAANKIIDHAHAGEKEKAIAFLPEFQLQFTILESDMGALGDKITERSQKSVKAAHETRDAAHLMNIILILSAIILSTVTSLLVIRNLQNSLKKLVNKLNHDASTVTTMSEQLNISSNGLSGATQLQSSALEQTASAVEEISAMVKKTAENSENLMKLAVVNKTAANRGQDSVAAVIQSIDSISKSNQRVIDQVEEDNKRLIEILDVITAISAKTAVINEIVFQTKLLSFNASVESARAGEHGKGFAVVAHEVGKLAAMSGVASHEITALISESTQKVRTIVEESKTRVHDIIIESRSRIESGHTVALDCKTALEDIVNQSSVVANTISQITVAACEQSDGLHEISDALVSLDRSTEQNVKASQATSLFSEQLSEQAHGLKHLVGTLNQMAS